ncbi:DUF4129 domain-containing protein [Nocardioides sp. Soil805]|uniref:DUF4129 domain-containing protein n=1 Tax=Nocardioides sp. Soil805 TaxID=1736416 RepID=UPI0007034E8D|nr:DUF4129 domain-containing protein [Nocardioides sp. Soil805]KRF35192.1 hypothetical protein ASG94_13865 [Nocardioides sp. Soil805]
MILRWPAEPPLVPTPDEGRSLLRRELLRPAYREDDLLGRLVEAVRRAIGRTIDAASSAPPLTTFFAMLVGLLLVLALLWLATRTRATRAVRGHTQVAVPDGSLSADQWRARADAAYSSGDHGTALVDGFRALAVRQVERGLLDDAPGATAHELGLALRVLHPGREPEVDEGARLFDLVLYGDRAATAEQARSVLALDDALAGAS